jgi:hypothetical protein
LENFGSVNRVVKKKFVEIAQAKKKQGMRMLLLDGVILPQQRCCRLCHECKLAPEAHDYVGWHCL